MNLIHQKLIRFLPYDNLLELHRRCCFLRGKAWGNKRYSDYIFKYPYNYLFVYHDMILTRIEECEGGLDNFKDVEMYNWSIHNYRGHGRFDNPHDNMMDKSWKKLINRFPMMHYTEQSYDDCLYKEHDNTKLRKDLLTLQKKNVKLIGTTIEEELIKCDLNGY